MSFVVEYLQHVWNFSTKGSDAADLKNWLDYLDTAEKDRARDRIVAWRDRVAHDDYAVNAEEPEYYRRSAGFLWRAKDPTGKSRARNHQYLYNLEVYGHKQYTRRDKTELQAAQEKVAVRAISGELGPLSPLDA